MTFYILFHNDFNTSLTSCTRDTKVLILGSGSLETSLQLSTQSCDAINIINILGMA